MEKKVYSYHVSMLSAGYVLKDGLRIMTLAQYAERRF